MVSQSLFRTARRFANHHHQRSISLLKNQKVFKSTAAIETKHESETFLNGSTSLYAEQMYENYSEDPNSVHETWKKYFDDMEQGKDYDESSFNRPTVVVSNMKKEAEARDSHLAVSRKLNNIVDIRSSCPRYFIRAVLTIDFIHLYSTQLFYCRVHSRLIPLGSRI
jgi:2-oxoglutarate dehydrogenase E1 component